MLLGSSGGSIDPLDGHAVLPFLDNRLLFEPLSVLSPEERRVFRHELTHHATFQGTFGLVLRVLTSCDSAARARSTQVTSTAAEASQFFFRTLLRYPLRAYCALLHATRGIQEGLATLVELEFEEGGTGPDPLSELDKAFATRERRLELQLPRRDPTKLSTLLELRTALLVNPGAANAHYFGGYLLIRGIQDELSKHDQRADDPRLFVRTLIIWLFYHYDILAWSKTLLQLMINLDSSNGEQSIAARSAELVAEHVRRLLNLEPRRIRELFTLAQNHPRMTLLRHSIRFSDWEVDNQQMGAASDEVSAYCGWLMNDRQGSSMGYRTLAYNASLLLGQLQVATRYLRLVARTRRIVAVQPTPTDGCILVSLLEAVDPRMNDTYAFDSLSEEAFRALQQATVNTSTIPIPPNIDIRAFLTPERLARFGVQTREGSRIINEHLLFDSQLSMRIRTLQVDECFHANVVTELGPAREVVVAKGLPRASSRDAYWDSVRPAPADPNEPLDKGVGVTENFVFSRLWRSIFPSGWAPHLAIDSFRTGFGGLSNEENATDVRRAIESGRIEELTTITAGRIASLLGRPIERRIFANVSR
ncbi:MAG: hypothetical protein QM817_40670 [Archangium sp.]